MIVDATTSTDVRDAMVVARERNLPFAVYATGHGGPMPEDGTVVVRTGRMGGVLVNPNRRTARVGAGVRWGEVIAAAAPFGLAPLSGTSTDVGVVGYTLGGGFSLLTRRYGFAADSVLRAEIVTADGRTRTVSADREPDLFWAIRGGGPNFGVVTALEFRLYPVSTVYAGTATFQRDRAAEVLTWYREAAAHLPNELLTNVVLTKDALTIRGAYAGSVDDARRALAPLFRVAGTPRTNDWRPMPYTESGTIGGTTPSHFNHVTDLPDHLIKATIDAVNGEANAVEVRLWSGAIANTDAETGPAGHRDAPFSVIVDGPAKSAAPIAALATGGTFLNGLADPSRAHTAYTTENYTRLREIKRTYDPDNFFSGGKNIPPAIRGKAALGA